MASFLLRLNIPGYGLAAILFACYIGHRHVLTPNSEMYSYFFYFVTCCSLSLVELVQDVLSNIYDNNLTTTISDFELGSSVQIAEDIFNFLDSRIYDVSNVNVLVFCNQACLLEILHQVSSELDVQRFLKFHSCIFRNKCCGNVIVFKLEYQHLIKSWVGSIRLSVKGHYDNV